MVDLLDAVSFAIHGDWEPIARYAQKSARLGRPLPPEVADFFAAVVLGELKRPPNKAPKKADRDQDTLMAFNVAELIAAGVGVTAAKQKVAEKKGVSFSTIERAWKKYKLLVTVYLKAEMQDGVDTSPSTDLLM
jgi:hypothetical protein